MTRHSVKSTATRHPASVVAHRSDLHIAAPPAPVSREFSSHDMGSGVGTYHSSGLRSGGISLDIWTFPGRPWTFGHLDIQAGHDLPWPAQAGHGRAWPAMAGHGRAWPGMAGHGRASGHGRAWPGMAGTAGHGRAWPAVAKHSLLCPALPALGRTSPI